MWVKIGYSHWIWYSMDFWIWSCDGFDCDDCDDDDGGGVGGKYDVIFGWLFLSVIVWYKSNGDASTVWLWLWCDGGCKNDAFDGDEFDLYIDRFCDFNGGTRFVCSVGPDMVFRMCRSGLCPARSSKWCPVPYVCFVISSIGPSWNVYVFVMDDLIGLNFGTYACGSFGILYCVMCCGGIFVSGIRILSSSMVCIVLKLSFVANLFGNFRKSSCNASTAFWFASYVESSLSVSCPFTDVTSCVS